MPLDQQPRHGEPLGAALARAAEAGELRAMTERSLQDFFDMLRSAQEANRARFADWCNILERIDRCFVRAGKNLIDPNPIMPGHLLLRCQYAFKTAAGMALAGQIVEAS
jgi:diadenosine tetraphosphate (Ap4A) HIT family hydrolase